MVVRIHSIEAHGDIRVRRNRLLAGFAGGGATVEDVALMRRVVGPEMGVKASGGVKSFEDAKNMVAAGATRLGASAGVKIVQGEHATEAVSSPVKLAAKAY